MGSSIRVQEQFDLLQLGASEHRGSEHLTCAECTQLMLTLRIDRLVHSLCLIVEAAGILTEVADTRKFILLAV